jgi:hypothetical protein
MSSKIRTEFRILKINNQYELGLITLDKENKIRSHIGIDDIFISGELFPKVSLEELYEKLDMIEECCDKPFVEYLSDKNYIESFPNSKILKHTNKENDYIGWKFRVVMNKISKNYEILEVKYNEKGSITKIDYYSNLDFINLLSDQNKEDNLKEVIRKISYDCRFEI